jgi:hypothetical protein
VTERLALGCHTPCGFVWVARLFARCPYADFPCGVFDVSAHFSSATPAFAAAARNPLSNVARGRFSFSAKSTYIASTLLLRYSLRTFTTHYPSTISAAAIRLQPWMDEP